MSNRADAADADEARQKEFVPKGVIAADDSLGAV